MTEQKTTRRLSRSRFVLRNALLLLVLGVAVHVLLPQITALRNSAEVLRQMRWWALAIAIFMQIGSYSGSGYMLDRIVNLFGMTLTLGRGVMIVMASSSLGMLWGGQVMSSGATFRWIRAQGVPTEGALMTGWLPALVNMFTLSAVSVFGLLYLLVSHNMEPALAIGFGAAVGTLGLIGCLVWWGLTHRDRFTSFLQFIGRGWSRLRRKPYDPASGESAAAQLFQAWDLLREGGWRGTLLGDGLNVGFDMLTLFFLFIAAGHLVSPGILLAGYGLPILLGKMSPFPGGVGVVEGSMAALYKVLGVPTGVTVVVILGYRLLSFWLPLLIGFPLVPFLDRLLRSETASEQHDESSE